MDVIDRPHPKSVEFTDSKGDATVAAVKLSDDGEKLQFDLPGGWRHRGHLKMRFIY